ncbi:MAG: agmatine deiminase family protein [Crocinitomicaceae bacterium]|nr:agmatine deiminase family protein [Crocinitomicaceae bacterium]
MLRPILIILFLFGLMSCDKTNTGDASSIQYTFPEESESHEGTWLQWPHHYQYGVEFRDRMDPI